MSPGLDPTGPYSAYRHRHVTRRLGLSLGVYCAILGLTQRLLWEPLRGVERWDPVWAQFSSNLNLFGGAAAFVSVAAMRFIPPRTRDPVRSYALIVRGVALFILAFFLVHMNLGGSHSSVVVGTIVLELVLVTWLAARRDVPMLLVANAAGLFGLFILEYAGILEYAPLFLDREILSVFQDWRVLVCDALLFLSFTTPLVLGVWRYRVKFEEREDQLEARVRERTSALSRQVAQTREAYGALADEVMRREETEAAGRALSEQLDRFRHAAVVGEVAGGIAHELIQPLSGVLANARAAIRMLDTTPADVDEVRLALQDIIDDERRAEAVIQGVRQLARQRSVLSERVALAEVIAETLVALTPTARDGGIELDVSSPPEVLPVWFSRVQLSQVLLNVVRNAIQACARGDIVRVSCEADPGGVRVVVSDTGPGFSQHALQHAFEPWVSTRPDGLGLGLAICRRIVESHGGDIEIGNSELGAQVILRIPAQTAPAQTSTMRDTREPDRLPYR